MGSRSEDRKYRVEDYPLLPVRRRFWEACFQAADAPGTHSQLRSQLRILHDSLQAIANQDLGAAIPASDLFDALAPTLNIYTHAVDASHRKAIEAVERELFVVLDHSGLQTTTQLETAPAASDAVN